MEPARKNSFIILNVLVSIINFTLFVCTGSTDHSIYVFTPAYAKNECANFLFNQ